MYKSNLELSPECITTYSEENVFWHEGYMGISDEQGFRKFAMTQEKKMHVMWGDSVSVSSAVIKVYFKMLTGFYLYYLNSTIWVTTHVEIYKYREALISQTACCTDWECRSCFNYFFIRCTVPEQTRISVNPLHNIWKFIDLNHIKFNKNYPHYYKTF